MGVGAGRRLSPRPFQRLCVHPSTPLLLWLLLGPLNRETFPEGGLPATTGPMAPFQRILFGVTHKDGVSKPGGRTPSLLQTSGEGPPPLPSLKSCFSPSHLSHLMLADGPDAAAAFCRLCVPAPYPPPLRFPSVRKALFLFSTEMTVFCGHRLLPTPNYCISSCHTMMIGGVTVPNLRS